jgi:pimeloyl-ACP methyl ester carboxylesterase
MMARHDMLQPLLDPYTLGDLPFRNRVVMAPLTRTRAENPGHVPTDLMRQYYEQCASAGLIISEGTWVSENARRWYGVPGEVPRTIAGMAGHALVFLDALGIQTCDVIGYSLGGMVALQMVQDRPSIFRRMILVGTAPRGGEDIMHLEKPSLAKRIQDPANRGYDVLKKIFFTSSPGGQALSEAFVQRLSRRKDDLDPPSGPKVAAAQLAAFREWEAFKGERFADLRAIRQPALVVNGVHDEMIAVRNS